VELGGACGHHVVPGGHGYDFYIYAPKVDPYLRKRWQEDHPAAEADQLEASPGPAAMPVSASAWDSARTRSSFDFEPATPGRPSPGSSASSTARHRRPGPPLRRHARRRTRAGRPAARRGRDGSSSAPGADRLIVCPTYYTDDPVLDRVFGDRPPGYLEELGRGLDPDVQVFWTGPEVVSREISTGHVDRVAEALGRKPFLWDNYPVNDGQRMSQYLHLRGFTGRPAGLAGPWPAHVINPALQPVLSRIPALTLPTATRRVPTTTTPPHSPGGPGGPGTRSSASASGRTCSSLQDVGLDRLDEKADRLRERYGNV
jgi:hyaluronoglucosaminidase